MNIPDRLESLAVTLDDSSDYRVLRRLKPRLLANPPDRVQTRIGLFLDLETTGLDPQRDEIIEFGMVPFVYTLDGEILGTLPAFDLKDILKARGYRWNDGSDGRPRAWSIDVSSEDKDAELAFLKAEIYLRDVELLTREITPWDRFSTRC